MSIPAQNVNFDTKCHKVGPKCRKSFQNVKMMVQNVAKVKYDTKTLDRTFLTQNVARKSLIGSKCHSNKKDGNI